MGEERRLKFNVTTVTIKAIKVFRFLFHEMKKKVKTDKNSQVNITVESLNLRRRSSPNMWGPSDLEGWPLRSQGHEVRGHKVRCHKVTRSQGHEVTRSEVTRSEVTRSQGHKVRGHEVTRSQGHRSQGHKV